MSKKNAKVGGAFAASVPILGLLSSYVLSCVKHGVLFAHDGWVYVPAGLSCLPTNLVLWPFYALIHRPLHYVSETKLGYHVLPVVNVALCAAVNFCVVYYALLFIGKLIRNSAPKAEVPDSAGKD